MAGTSDPNVQRLRLGAALRKNREAADLTQRKAAEDLEWSLSKLTRIESGAHGVSLTDLRAMLDLYHVTDASEVDDLRELARGTRGQPWWQDYRDIVSPQFARFLGYEDAAASYRVFHPYLIPGLLHTRDYATELLSEHSAPGRTQRIADLRSVRQERTFERQSVSHDFILNEEALYRWIGGPDTMRHQLQHLIDASGQPNVSIRVIPFRAGTHPGLLSPIIILGLEEETGGHIVYMESYSGDQLIRDDMEEVDKHVRFFDELQAKALSGEKTIALLKEQIKRLDQA